MKISKEDAVIVIAILGVAGCIILGVKLQSANDLLNKEESFINKVQQQNDSIISFQINDAKKEAEMYHVKFDSSIAVAKSYQKQDSINKIKYANEKNKVKHYSPKQLNSAYDSIFGKSQ